MELSDDVSFADSKYDFLEMSNLSSVDSSTNTG